LPALLLTLVVLTLHITHHQTTHRIPVSPILSAS
jgi:hypothetical protein